ncbi:hypothetical protein L0F48_06365 [Klebsiella pneumoniae]|nr:hypothetical protein [Klebsiella pneumoniae]
MDALSIPLGNRMQELRGVMCEGLGWFDYLTNLLMDNLRGSWLHQMISASRKPASIVALTIKTRNIHKKKNLSITDIAECSYAVMAMIRIWL